MRKPCQELKRAIGWCIEKIEELNANITNMKEKLVKLQEVEIENQKHKDKLAKLYDMEVIDSDGEVK